MIGAAAIIATVAISDLLMAQPDVNKLPLVVRILIAIPVLVGLASPFVLASAAWDVIKARRCRSEFEDFQRSYGRDPDAVQTPKSWTVE